MNKRTITLEDGSIVDCGIQEFEELRMYMQKENPKKIAAACVKVLMSSDIMMAKLVKDVTDEFSKYKKEKDDKND